MHTDISLCFYHLAAHSHSAGPPQQLSRPVEDLEIDHAAVTARLSGVGAVELHQAALQGLQQLRLDVRVAQDVVGRHDTLPGVVKAGPSNALCGGGNVAVSVHVTRVLAPQDQGDGRERAGCSASNPAALLPVA